MLRIMSENDSEQTKILSEIRDELKSMRSEFINAITLDSQYNSVRIIPEMYREIQKIQKDIAELRKMYSGEKTLDGDLSF
jgi:hypothetical protein